MPFLCVRMKKKTLEPERVSLDQWGNSIFGGFKIVAGWTALIDASRDPTLLHWTNEKSVSSTLTVTLWSNKTRVHPSLSLDQPLAVSSVP